MGAGCQGPGAYPRPKVTYITHVYTGLCRMSELSIAIQSKGGLSPLVIQAPVLVDSLLQSHHWAICVLSSIYNVSKKLKSWIAQVEISGSSSFHVFPFGRSWLHGLSLCRIFDMNYI